MKILITGCAGFLGFHLSKKLLQNKKNSITGIDNLNDYYSVKLKNKRLNILKKNKNFHFKKIDIENKKKLNNFLNKKKIDIIYHLAAQAGVRYSLVNPESYLKSNIEGFFNILEFARLKKIKKIIYASSSSVYGDQKKFPIKENFKKNQKNLYAITKDFNEKLAQLYFDNFKLKLVGLRFFTVYGAWGRPDMIYFKYLNSLKFNRLITLYNNGNHYRDFTYIDDVIEMMLKIKNLNNSIFTNKVFNICSGKSISLIKYLKEIEKLYGKKCKIKKIGKQKIEIFKTHGDNKLIRKLINKNKFINYKTGLKETVNWFKNFHLK
jgi:UDP-glucuronate 4-epimerase